MKQGKSNENVQHYKNFGSGNSLEKRKEVENIKNKRASQTEKGSCQPQFCTLNCKEEMKMPASSSTAVEDKKSSIVFKGKRFCFSSSFPANQVSILTSQTFRNEQSFCSARILLLLRYKNL